MRDSYRIAKNMAYQQQTLLSNLISRISGRDRPNRFEQTHVLPTLKLPDRIWDSRQPVPPSQFSSDTLGRNWRSRKAASGLQRSSRKQYYDYVRPCFEQGQIAVEYSRHKPRSGSKPKQHIISRNYAFPAQPSLQLPVPCYDTDCVLRQPFVYELTVPAKRPVEEKPGRMSRYATMLLRGAQSRKFESPGQNETKGTLAEREELGPTPPHCIRAEDSGRLSRVRNRPTARGGEELGSDSSDSLDNVSALVLHG